MRRESSLRAVVEAAQRGEHAAWSELVARFQDFAVGMAVACSGDWDGAPDAAQEAFGLAFRKLDDLEDPDAFPGWFATLVRTACSRRTAREAARGGLARRHRRGRPAPARSRGARRRLPTSSDHVRAAIEALPEPERAVIALHYLGDLTYPELAAFLGISAAAAKKRAFTARRRLEELLPMATDALSAARPSRSDRFRATILLFVAIRDRDVETVARLIRTDPALVHATEDWSTDEALAAGLQFTFAGRALGADPGGRRRATSTSCACWSKPARRCVISATARAPSHRCGRQPSSATARWWSTCSTRAQIRTRPRSRARHRCTSPCNAATTISCPRLLAAGADPDRVDDYGRTPADWLALHRPDSARPGRRIRVRARPVSAPSICSRRCTADGVQHWPPAVGLGQTVLLFAIAAALRPAEFWLVGFEHGPYSQAGAEQRDPRDGRRLPRAPRARGCGRERAARAVRRRARGLPPRSQPEARRVARRSRARARRDARAPDPRTRRERPRRHRDRTVRRDLSRRSRPNRPRVSTRRSRSTCGGRGARFWPAVDPARTTSRWYPSARHEHLATATRAALATVSFEADAELPPIARYFAQPFEIAEPFTSRPGERTQYAALLDEVEALLAAT